MSKPELPPEEETFTDKLRVYAFYIIDPIVTVLAKIGIGPDALTILGMALHFLFAYLITIGEMRWAAVAMTFAVPLDALDGSLARKLEKKDGDFGAFLDSTLDRLAEIILFGGFIFYFDRQGNFEMLVVSYIAVTGSVMVSYARAKAESIGYTAKVGVLSRVERYVLIIVFLFLNWPSVAIGIMAIGTYVTLLQRLFSVRKQAYTQAAQDLLDKEQIEQEGTE